MVTAVRVEPRHRCVPARDGSRGPEVVEFACEHGLELDGWQADAIDDFNGSLEERSSSRSNLLILSRQNGKSEILVAQAMFCLFVLRKRLTLYSSHQWASSNEIFLRLKGIIQANPDLEEQVKHVRLSAALLGFELHTGERLTFLTRSRAAARGFSADGIFFDEAHFLSEAAHAALVPSAAGRSARGAVQMFYAASPVDQGRHADGLVLARLRKAALEGEEGVALVEYGAGLVDDEGRDLLPVAIPAGMSTDLEVLARANPGYPERISAEFLLDRARTMDPQSFWTEFGGQGDWPDLDATASGIIDQAKWAAQHDPDSRPLPPIVISFDVSPDRRRASIGIGGKRGDENFHGELADNALGIGWLVPRLKQLIEDHDPAFVVCDAQQERLAEEVLAETGRPCMLLDRGDLAQACAMFVDLVEEGRLWHLGDPLLLDAIRGATVRSFGADGWIFSRRSSRIDISPLYAAVLALYAARDIDPNAEWRIL